MILMLNANKNVMRNYLHKTCESISTQQINEESHSLNNQSKI